MENKSFRFLLIFSFFFLAFAIAETGQAQITITQVSDMDFGTAPQGDPRKTIQNTNAETAENASFLVTGPGGSPFTVTMPNEIYMIINSGATNNEQIRVFRFRHKPGNPKIRNNGTRMLYIAARRRAIRANQVVGSYSATFTIDVVL